MVREEHMSKNDKHDVFNVRKRFDPKTMSMKKAIVKTADDVADVAASDNAVAAKTPPEKQAATPSKNARKRIRKLVGKKKSE